MSVNPVTMITAAAAWPVAAVLWLTARLRYAFRQVLRRPATTATEGPTEMSDPQWGKKNGSSGNEGPPDLDEILKKVNQKLSGIFGRGGNEGGSSGGGQAAGPGPGVGGGIAIAAGLAVSVWLAMGFYIVESGKQGLELRFGKFSKRTDAGPNWHWPYPIETVEIVNIQQVEVVEIGHRNNQKIKVKEEALMLTEDQNIVELQFAVQYVLKSPDDFVFKNKDPKEAVRQVAETSMREIVGKSKMDFVLYEGRTDIADRAKTLMQKLLDLYSTGIQVSTVTLQNAQPPADVQASFDDAVRAKQDRERLKNEGEAYANDILPRARGGAARLMEEANGHKQRVIANAQGDASRFAQILTEYEKAPGVTRERLYLDAMQQVMQSTSKVVVDQKGGQSLLYLPLDKLIQATTGPAPASADAPATRVGATTDAAAVAPATNDSGRTRDLRSRDGR